MALMQIPTAQSLLNPIGAGNSNRSDSNDNRSGILGRPVVPHSSITPKYWQSCCFSTYLSTCETKLS
ncbi:MAG: hypothetical protein CM15mV111_250 [uncultured marine virus]|nr:MAG: hypothetical protein CM15mV111_250 [uncultured marine virus]